MNKLARRIIAIIDLVLMVPFIVFLVMALGFSKAAGGYAVPLASVLGCVVLILFLVLKMDEYRTKRIEERTQSTVSSLESGENALDAEIENNTAVSADEELLTDETSQAEESKKE